MLGVCAWRRVCWWIAGLGGGFEVRLEVRAPASSPGRKVACRSRAAYKCHASTPGMPMQKKIIAAKGHSASFPVYVRLQASLRTGK